MADVTDLSSVSHQQQDDDDDDLLSEIRELIEQPFFGTDSSDYDSDQINELSKGYTDSSPADSSEYDSDKINELIDDSFLVIDPESSSSIYSHQQRDDLLFEVGELISVVERNSSARAVTRRSIQFLSELAKNEDYLMLLVQSGVVPALVKHLQDTQWPNEAVIGFDLFVSDAWPLEHEVETHRQVLSRLLHFMNHAEKIVQRRILLALAQFCSPEYLKEVFVDNKGLNLLLEVLKSRNHQGEASAALCKLAGINSSVSPVDAGPSSPISQVYLGEEYVNNPLISDVTFIIEGKHFHAHRIVLMASSNAFRAMFDGGYKESDAKEVQIPDITWEIFDLMMRFIYTGSVEVNMVIAQDLLKAADQYLLDGLKRLCEYTMARDIDADNIVLMYDLSETYNAVSLRNACILFVLDQYDKLHSKPWYAGFVLQILPEIENYFMTTLTKPMEANSQR